MLVWDYRIIFFLKFDRHDKIRNIKNANLRKSAEIIKPVNEETKFNFFKNCAKVDKIKNSK